jgi:hypothetical protein
MPLHHPSPLRLHPCPAAHLPCASLLIKYGASSTGAGGVRHEGQCRRLAFSMARVCAAVSGAGEVSPWHISPRTNEIVAPHNRRARSFPSKPSFLVRIWCPCLPYVGGALSYVQVGEVLDGFGAESANFSFRSSSTTFSNLAQLARFYLY